MKIVVATDSYKGCMSAKEVAQAIQNGIKKADPAHEVITVPMADGGEGTAEIFKDVIRGKWIPITCKDAYGQPVHTGYAFDGKTAVMDVASCIGLNMVERSRRNPMITNSYGVGEMMKDAIEQGCQTLVVGLGGSSTNDGGMGLLQAFGVRFLDGRQRELQAGIYALKRVRSIDASAFHIPEGLSIVAMCDVQNRLLGEEGATFTFGKQKGIFLNQMKEIDSWMKNYAQKIQEAFGVDITQAPGSGAAGGIGAVLLGLFGAKMESGIDYMIRQTGLEQLIQDSDLVITGEGQSDAQTLYGKVPYGILQVANRHSKPTVCLSGALSTGYEKLYDAGMIGVFSSADRAMTFQQALASGPQKLEALAYSLMKYTKGIQEGIR